MTTALHSLPGWGPVGHSLVKVFSFDSYAKGVLFATAVAHLSERLDRHPELLVKWGSVTVTTWTHDAGGVTGMDVELAQRIEAL